MASQWNLPFAVARMLAVVSIVAGLCLRASGAACADPNNASQSARIGGHFSTPIDRLCFPTEIFVAEILRTSLTDYRLNDPTVPICDPKDELTLRIRVDEMIAANEQELARLHVRVAQPNDSIDVVTKLYNSRPTDMGANSRQRMNLARSKLIHHRRAAFRPADIRPVHRSKIHLRDKTPSV
jgi:hypothetical protein